jgi:crossover junction endodeoxyribonuclease RuvC
MSKNTETSTETSTEISSAQASAQGSDIIILGIDPGTNIMGYGLIHNKDNNIKFITMDVLKLNKFNTQALKLKKIFESTLDIINKYKPDELAIEAPFFGKNVQSMLKLGRAEGVAMAAALYKDIPIFEYSPRKIKQSITGNGNASKQQVAKMLYNLLDIKKISEYLDSTDALAVALCHYFQKNRPIKSNAHKPTSWKSFVSDNPDRVR